MKNPFKWMGSLEATAAELIREYAERLTAGQVVSPEDFILRCRALEGRGLARGVARELCESGNARILRDFEALTDDQLAEFSRYWTAA